MKKSRMNLDIKSVDEYIGLVLDEVKEKLIAIRTIIKENAPEATEHILYGMPAYKTFKKPLVYFAAYDKHIGFYATPTGNITFAKELKKYKTGKGSIQFPLSEPLPVDLIERIVKFRVDENIAKYKKN